jgi:hypothetical protein
VRVDAQLRCGGAAARAVVAGRTRLMARWLFACQVGRRTALTVTRRPLRHRTMPRQPLVPREAPVHPVLLLTVTALAGLLLRPVPVARAESVLRRNVRDTALGGKHNSQARPVGLPAPVAAPAKPADLFNMFNLQHLSETDEVCGGERGQGRWGEVGAGRACVLFPHGHRGTGSTRVCVRARCRCATAQLAVCSSTACVRLHAARW